MSFETATDIRPSQKTNIVAILSSATSMERCRLWRHFLFWLERGRIPDDIWRDVERQSNLSMDTSAHTAEEFVLEYKTFSYEPVVNLCLEVPFIEEESSSALVESEEVTRERIRTLVENGRVSEAQNILSKIAPGISSRLDTWRKVLTRPTVRLEETTTGGNLTDDTRWLQQHSMNYKGQWVALKQGILLGSHANRLELHRYLKQLGKLAEAMFFRIDA